MYHGVPVDGPGDALAVPVRQVDRQWHALRSQGWDLVGLTEALSRAGAGDDRVIGVTFDDGYADFLGALELLAAHHARATLYVPTAHLDGEPIVGCDGPLLTWDQVGRLPSDLVEIGSHAHRHRPLDVLGREDVAADVVTSRRLLRERLGVSASSFCYPNGYSSPRVRAAVASAGFSTACVVGRRLADPDGDPLAIPRLQVTPAHDEVGILALVAGGEPGLTPAAKRIVHPAWRQTRRVVYRATGKVLT
jgi:peptidoglycan/xylan/chitin deacetylase (PgdA/CDA1 family)